jgi:hypothetical protein
LFVVVAATTRKVSSDCIPFGQQKSQKVCFQNILFGQQRIKAVSSGYTPGHGASVLGFGL